MRASTGWRLAVLLLVAQIPVASPATAKDDSAWRWRTDADLTLEYNDNVLGLNQSGRDRVRTQASADQLNGRLNGLDSVDDFGVISEIEFQASRESDCGRTKISPRFAYTQYIENSQLSFPELGLQLEQSLCDAGALKFDLEASIGVAKRNYLAGTVGTGEITDAERIYRRGRFDDWELNVGYEHRLWRHKKSRRKNFALAEVTGEVEFEYGQRIYRNGSFANRDLDVWGVGLGLESDLGKWIDLGVSYRFARVDAPGRSEVLILDEPDVGSDLNGDFDALDSNIRTVASVDRSRNEHRFGADLDLRLHKRVRAWLSYDYAMFDYLSDRRLDLSFRDRRDAINRVGAGVRWRLTKIFAITLEGIYSDRAVNRSASLDEDEDGQKERTIVRIGIGARF